ncbi:hypothetical protein [Arthrobacter sp. D3-16]
MLWMVVKWLADSESRRSFGFDPDGVLDVFLDPACVDVDVDVDGSGGSFTGGQSIWAKVFDWSRRPKRLADFLTR